MKNILSYIVALALFSPSVLLRAQSFRVPGLADDLVLRPQKFGDPSANLAVSAAYTQRMTRFVKDMIQIALQKPQQLGTKVSWLDLNQIVTELDTVELYINLTSEAIVGSGKRIGSVYLPEQKAVILNVSLLMALNQANSFQATTVSQLGIEVLLLHEYLGALGYPDDNYEISTWLYMRSMPQDYTSKVVALVEKSVEEHLEAHPRQKQNPQFLLAGGSTGVGGGGDPASAAVKLLAFVYISNFYQRTTNFFKLGPSEMEDFVRFISRVQIEPADESIAYDSKLPKGSFLRLQTKDGVPFIEVFTSIVFNARSLHDSTEVAYQMVLRCLDLFRGKQ